MDDNRFDKFVKDKVEDYKDKGVDKAAFADMQTRIAALPKGSPWYAQYRMIGAAAALLTLFTIINYLISWHFSQKQFQELQQEMALMKQENNRYALLEEELQTLKLIKIDTVYIYRQQMVSNDLKSNADRSNSGAYQPILNGFNANDIKMAHDRDLGEYDGFVAISNMDGLTDEIKNFLNEHFLLIKDQDGGLYLNTEEGRLPGYLVMSGNNTNTIFTPMQPIFLGEINDRTNETTETRSKYEGEQLSAQTLRALAKHHHSGVDWQFGFESYLLKSEWERGKGKFNPGFGLLGEAILSPSLRLEFGVKINDVEYNIAGIDTEGIAAEDLARYPDIDSDLGDLTTIEVGTQMLNFPLNLKYYYPVARNKSIYAGIGYAPQLYLRQEFDYKYNLKLDNPPGENFEAFVGANRDVDSRWYVGSVNASIGTEIALNHKLRWQIGAFYERSLGEMGVEGIKFSTVGLKSSIWFNKP